MSAKYNNAVERLNSEGIPRHQLKHALSKYSTVMTARRINHCLLCRAKGVNEAGLCDICYPLIQEPEELALVQKWLSGEGP